jgi:hypothetical protein
VNHSLYSEDLVEKICARLEKGESLRSICRDPQMPSRTTFENWISNKPEFAKRYYESRNIGLDMLADEVLEIADDGSNDYMKEQTSDGADLYRLNGEHINRSRLRVDTRKWYLGKLAPKRYGESQRIEHTGKDGGPIETVDSITMAREILAALRVAAKSE